MFIQKDRDSHFWTAGESGEEEGKKKLNHLTQSFTTQPNFIKISFKWLCCFSQVPCQFSLLSQKFSSGPQLTYSAQSMEEYWPKFITFKIKPFYIKSNHLYIPPTMLNFIRNDTTRVCFISYIMDSCLKTGILSYLFFHILYCLLVKVFKSYLFINE